jgi:glycosyltransferase involved in cell wall biosynthesis
MDSPISFQAGNHSGRYSLAQKMKLAFLAPYLSSASGGLAQSVPGLAGALATTGHVSPRIFGVRDKKEREGWRTWGADVRPCSEIGPRAFGWAPSLLHAIAEYQPDIVDVQGLWMYPSLASFRWYGRLRQPYVVTPRGMLDPWALQRSAWKKRIVRWWFEDNHLHGATCLRATSTMEAEHFRAFGLSNPIAVVPNGIDLPLLITRPQEQARPNRILFLSRVHPKKGIDFLLRAWSNLYPSHPDWELIIAGPDEIGYRGQMQTLAEKLRLERVVWHEPVYGEEKSDLYASADLFVLPTHAENFGLVIGEALAHGVPVITTRNAPWHGLETHRCGWWINLSDGALTEAIKEAMRLPNIQRREMGARGRAWVETAFGWPSVGEQMCEVYRWILSGGAPPPSVVVD